MSEIRTLKSYPLVIEAAVGALEVCETLACGRDRWRVFYRVPLVDVAFRAPGLPTSAAHIFADMETVAKSTVLLAYSATGLIQGLLASYPEGWRYEALPEELTGQVVSQPSIRLSFVDDFERHTFLQKLRTPKFSSLARHVAAQPVIVDAYRAVTVDDVIKRQRLVGTIQPNMTALPVEPPAAEDWAELRARILLSYADVLDTVLACLRAAGGSETPSELQKQLEAAGSGPADFIRKQFQGKSVE